MGTSASVFLRGTAYRWAQRWPELCPDLVDAPQLLAVGDLHAENFGTWSDGDSRFVWGINDLDEATTLPYTNDLVRLLTSIVLAVHAGHLSLDTDVAADAIVEGYGQSLADGGRPFVVGEHHRWLWEFVQHRLKDPPTFWNELAALPVADDVEPTMAEALAASLPQAGPPHRLVRRTAGVGSLGRRRVVALSNWRGGYVAREAKAIVPSAWRWVAGTPGDVTAHAWEIERCNDQAVRSPDPTYRAAGAWLVRRLAPDAVRIELAGLPRPQDERVFVRAMGSETANLHLATPSQTQAVVNDLAARPHHWLRKAAEVMAKDTVADWETWKARKLSPKSAS
jgi:hypothetical protein